MHRASIQAARPLRSLSHLVQRNVARSRFSPLPTRPSAASISTVQQRPLPVQTKRAFSRPSGRPLEPPIIDPQAAIPPAAAVDPKIAGAPASSVPEISATSPSRDLPSGDSSVYGDANGTIDWSSSFHGLATAPFPPETNAVLLRPIPHKDVEIKPDGIIYLPEIKYRRILNEAFGPGGWGLAPRGELAVGEKVVTREYALVVHGRFMSQARGECAYFSTETIPTAGEGCKSNALLRCCKDLGVASELWDPRYIREFKATQCQEVWVEHAATKKRRQIWLRKGDAPTYPFVLAGKAAAARSGTA